MSDTKASKASISEAGVDTIAQGWSGSWPIWLVVVVCVCIEAVLYLGELGVIEGARFRNTAYEYAGFWGGLLENWRPNYAAQPYTMFVTYGFLHGGILHLVVNMVTLVSLGMVVLRRVGAVGFFLLYFISMVGGALGFAILTEAPLPMVGASGALFGLAGGLLAWNYVDRFSIREKLTPVLQATVLLVAMNVALWWAMDGQLAWQTHLGGFVSGWIASLLIDPRSRATSV